MKKILLISATLLSIGLAKADNSGTEVPVNDYPTQARVEYVFQCMHKYDTKYSYDTMYGCVCSADKIAARIPYANFVSTSTLAVMINTAGERGGVFRDVPGGRKVIREFNKFISDTEQSCGLKVKQKS